MEFEEAIHNEELGDLLHTASSNDERDGNSNPLTWITDLEGRILTCNREASDLLDTLLETDSDHSIFDLPVSDLQRQSIIALYKNGQFPAVISVNLTADGTENQVYVFSFNPSNGDGGELQSVNIHARRQNPEQAEIVSPLSTDLSSLPPVDDQNSEIETLDNDFFKLTKTAPLGTLPGSNQATLIDGIPVRTIPISGLAMSNNKFQPAENVWTQEALESFSSDEITATGSFSDTPAVLASPLHVRDRKAGVVELVDVNPERTWSEDDRLLLEEVTRQLGLALENAQLYSAVRKELTERVKAEEETSRRNRDLATLNTIGQRLSSLVSRAQIFDILTSSLQEIFNTQNLMISMVDSDTQQLTFPVCLFNGKDVTLPDRGIGQGYQESVIKNKTPLLIKTDAVSILSDSSLDHPGGIPQSLLAIPFLAGDRAIGVISIFDFSKENAFDKVQEELLSTIASQTATSLENANLFAEIRNALEIIEVRERFQKNVTQAVAALTERGSKATPQVLEALSSASLSTRIYYAAPSTDPDGGSIWKVASVFESLSLKPRQKNLRPDVISCSSHPQWTEELKKHGFLSLSRNTGNESDEEFLQETGIESLLLLAVQTQDEQVGFIAFENHGEPHSWTPDEIAVLRIASDAYANTLIREGLLSRLEISLAETGELYSASHKLALANTLPEMVAAVLSAESSKQINRGVLVLFSTDQEGQIENMKVAASHHNGVGTPPPPVGTEYLRTLYEPIFNHPDPSFFNDIANSDLDPSVREILKRQNVHSMAVLPLWSTSRQIGVLLLQSSLTDQFMDQQVHTFPPLVSQLTTAVENLNLFEQTQEALSETELLYKISSGIAQAHDLHDLTRLVGETVLPKNAEQLLLFVSPTRSKARSGDLEVIGAYTSQGKYFKSTERVPFETLSFIDFDHGEPYAYSNLSKSAIPAANQRNLARLGFISGCFIPLQAGGTTIGLLATGSTKPSDIRSEELHLLQVVGNSITVAIERQRLLNEAQRRALELQAAAEIARDTTSTLSLDTLLSRIVTLLKDRFGFYHCSIFLIDPTGTYAQISESTGKAGEELKKKHHQLAIGSKSVIGSCTASGNPVVVNDVSKSPIYYPNPLLPETRAEMAIPMKIGGNVIGALDVQSKRVSAFTQDELSVLQILSDQIAVAIENARAYEMSQQAVTEMQELDRVKNQFLANMSHELRTPLNSVIGFSRVILKGIDGPINDVQEQDINAIYKSGMHLLTMINEILDLSKIDAGKMELQLESVNLSDVVNSVISNTAGLVREKPIEVIQKVDSTIPRLMIDETRVGQVLINLISNAVKFTEKGSITIEAKIAENPFGKQEVLVTVTDTGMGIAPADQSKLFQRFSQVDDSPTRKTGGTGLGLSICRSLIEMHGGQIGLLSSEIGKGSVFYFTLPIPEEKRIDQNQLKFGENVILSIDDDGEVIELYQRFLEPNGYKVVPLTDPEQAVAKAIELKPFAITLDIMMPQKDGWQLINELKENELTRNIPILVCSILEEEEKGFSMGASDYLVKPFAADDLSNAILRLDRDHTFREVLLIDDSDDDQRMIRKMIEQSGQFHVTPALSGEAGLEAMKRMTPDILLLDLFMDGMNGLEVLERIRADKRLNRIPVIILTGADLSKEQRNELADMGPRLISKSVLKEQELLNELEAALQKYKINLSK
ncbi:MAG: GAF domain-containing protein [Anaerolineaceae bacterium]